MRRGWRVAYKEDLRQARRDEVMRRWQRGAFKERWGDTEGAEGSLQGRLEASKER